MKNVNKMTKEKVLEIGAGNYDFKQKENLTKLDVHQYGDIDVIYDVEKLSEKGEKLPFEGNTFDKVRAKQVLEHIENLEALFGEVYRILKDGGKFIVEVPHRKGPGAYHEMGEYGHCNYFNEQSLLHFGENEHGDQNERLESEFNVELVRTYYNWESGRFPNPLKFYIPERIVGVFTKNDEVDGYLCDSLLKSFLFKIFRLDGGKRDWEDW